MLERITIVTHIIIIIVGIGEERIACRKHITPREVRHRQLGLLRLLDDVEALLVVRQIRTQFVAQVRVSVSVAHNLHRLGASDTAMIRRHNHLAVGLCYQFEEI